MLSFRRFGHPFELPLLWQSIIMIIAMLVMLHVCVKVKSDLDVSTHRKHFLGELEKGGAFFFFEAQEDRVEKGRRNCHILMDMLKRTNQKEDLTT